jgi:hypothetical protein
VLWLEPQVAIAQKNANSTAIAATSTKFSAFVDLHQPKAKRTRTRIASALYYAKDDLQLAYQQQLVASWLQLLQLLASALAIDLSQHNLGLTKDHF